MQDSVRILLSGCCGKMGKAVTAIAAGRTDCEIIAGVDVFAEASCEYPVFKNISDISVKPDVIIDFSHPSALSSLLEYAIVNRLPVILCTTGYSNEQLKSIRHASQVIPVFHSGNMSLGINLLMELAKKAAAVLGSSFDIEIVEKHHNQKIDAPSGTALMLADAVSTQLTDEPQLVYDRHSYRQKRSKNEIGIHSVRGGTIVGEHEVIFAGNNEVITLAHSAQSKAVFASGAINAAIFLSGKNHGLYNMGDLVSDKVSNI